MPARLEKALKKSAEAAGIRRGSERWRRYVYGSLARIKQASKERENAQ